MDVINTGPRSNKVMYSLAASWYGMSAAVMSWYTVDGIRAHNPAEWAICGSLAAATAIGAVACASNAIQEIRK